MEWRQIPGFNYDVSDTGLVRRAFCAPKVNGTYPGKILGQHKRPGKPYLNVSLFKDGRLRHYGIHYLVCLAFHGERPSPTHQAAHWDDNPVNNIPSNLRWATAKENAEDRARNGRTASLRGELNPKARLTEEVVIAITREPKTRGYQQRLAERFGIGRTAINLVIRGITWTHLTGIKRSTVRNAMAQIGTESRAGRHSESDGVQPERTGARTSSSSEPLPAGAGADNLEMPGFLKRSKEAAE